MSNFSEEHTFAPQEMGSPTVCNICGRTLPLFATRYQEGIRISVWGYEGDTPGQCNLPPLTVEEVLVAYRDHLEQKELFSFKGKPKIPLEKVFGWVMLVAILVASLLIVVSKAL